MRREDPYKAMMVCNKCFTAASWYGEFMCDNARTAGTTRFTRAHLKGMKRKLVEVYGTTDI
jgi:hypothetical protein